MVKFLSTTVFFAFLLIIAGGSSSFMLERFDASIVNYGSNEIKLTWVVANDAEVVKYKLKRKMSFETSFQNLSDVQVSQGVSSGDKTEFSYTDKNVYKNTGASEPVVYALHAEFINGETVFLSQADVTITTTAVRRTWGSIKAMFQ